MIKSYNSVWSYEAQVHTTTLSNTYALTTVRLCHAHIVFALLDAAATIYFARHFGAASIGERLLIESGVY